VDDEPQEVQNNRNSDPNNGNSHVSLVEKVLCKDEHDHREAKEVKEMVLVEHYEQFDANEYSCNDEDDLEGPAFFS
jgi:hypothetical protein